MINAKSLDIVHTHTHTGYNLSAVKTALFSVDEKIYSELKANKTY